MSAEWGEARWSENLDEASTLVAVGTADQPDLQTLATEANRYHAEAEESAYAALELAWQAGRALLAAKAQVRHGEWLPWLAANFKGSDRTAQLYMRLTSNTKRVADLDSGQSLREAIKALCKTSREPAPPEPPSSVGSEPPEVSAEPAQPKNEPTQPKPPAQPKTSLAGDYADEMDLLAAAVAGFVDIVGKIAADDRWPKVRKRIADQQLGRLGDLIDQLDTVGGELAEDDLWQFNG